MWPFRSMGNSNGYQLLKSGGLLNPGMTTEDNTHKSTNLYSTQQQRQSQPVTGAVRGDDKLQLYNNGTGDNTNYDKNAEQLQRIRETDKLRINSAEKDIPKEDLSPVDDTKTMDFSCLLRKWIYYYHIPVPLWIGWVYGDYTGNIHCRMNG